MTLSNALHSVWQSLGLSMLLQMALFHFFLWLSKIPLLPQETNKKFAYISLITVVISHIMVLTPDFSSVNTLRLTGSIRRKHLKDNFGADRDHTNLSSLITHDKLHYRSCSFKLLHDVCMCEFQTRCLTTLGRIHIFTSLYLPTMFTLCKSKVIRNRIY